ncbi:MAG: winged helix DNA-binding domain-containing protein [Chloroflexota bacterium]|nr:winged helix DNA-binding domain-containing protein [Chloroflexota bacterium]
MKMNRFTLNQVNRFILRKQHLTEDSKGNDVVQVVKDVCALHAQVPTTPYLSVFQRVRGFAHKDLKQELYRKKSLAKVKCMRGTLFILPKELVAPAVVATRKQFVKKGDLLKLYAYMQRTFEKVERDSSPFKVSEEDIERFTEEILDLLKDAEKGLTVEEIKSKLESEVNVSYLISSLCDRGILARGEPGKWTTAKHKYVLWDHWFPDVKLEMDEKEARATLIQRYLAAFGPVTEDDISWWTGFSKTVVRKGLEKMGAETEEIEVQGLDGTFILLKSDLAGLESISGADNTVRLLPRFDAYVVGYKGRRRLITQAHQDKVYWRTRGEVAASILANGRIVGTWTHKKASSKLTVTFSLFEEVSDRTLEKIHAEAERVGEFIGGKDFIIRQAQT